MHLETVRSALQRRGYDVNGADASSSDAPTADRWRAPDVRAQGEDQLACWVVDRVDAHTVIRAQAAARGGPARPVLAAETVEDAALPWARRYGVEVLDADDLQAATNGANGDGRSPPTPSTGSPPPTPGRRAWGIAPPLDADDGVAGNGAGPDPTPAGVLDVLDLPDADAGEADDVDPDVDPLGDGGTAGEPPAWVAARRAAPAAGPEPDAPETPPDDPPDAARPEDVRPEETVPEDGTPPSPSLRPRLLPPSPPVVPLDGSREDGAPEPEDGAPEAPDIVAPRRTGLPGDDGAGPETDDPARDGANELPWDPDDVDDEADPIPSPLEASAGGSGDGVDPPGTPLEPAEEPRGFPQPPAEVRGEDAAALEPDEAPSPAPEGELDPGPDGDVPPEDPAEADDGGALDGEADEDSPHREPEDAEPAPEPSTPDEEAEPESEEAPDPDTGPGGTPYVAPAVGAEEDPEPAPAAGESYSAGEAAAAGPGTTGLDALVEAATESSTSHAGAGGTPGATSGATAPPEAEAEDAEMSAGEGPDAVEPQAPGSTHPRHQEGSGVGFERTGTAASTDPRKIAEDVMREVEAEQEQADAARATDASSSSGNAGGPDPAETGAELLGENPDPAPEPQDRDPADGSGELPWSGDGTDPEAPAADVSASDVSGPGPAAHRTLEAPDPDEASGNGASEATDGPAGGAETLRSTADLAGPEPAGDGAPTTPEAPDGPSGANPETDDAAMRRHDPELWGTSGRIDDVRNQLRDKVDSPHARARKGSGGSGWLDDVSESGGEA